MIISKLVKILMNLELRKGCSNVILGKSQMPVTEVQIFNLSICKKLMCQTKIHILYAVSIFTELAILLSYIF